jgi:CHAT domain-containing protein
MGPFRPDSLVQSLWRAGVPTVVATRWEVEERASVAVMRPLLEGLLEGKPAAVALRGAVAALRRDPSLDHPAAWAAFHVFGIGGKETHHGG